MTEATPAPPRASGAPDDAPVDGRFGGAVDAVFDRLRDARQRHEPRLEVTERGRVHSVVGGIAHLSGLPQVGYEELVAFDTGQLGLVLDLRPDRVGVVLLDDVRGVEAGVGASRTGRVMDVPVGEALLGRVVDPAGRVLDGGGPIRSEERRPLERRPPPIMDRAPVSTPLQTGITVVDALVPIGRGQRQLIVGDRQTGKTAIALDTILNQRGGEVTCVYCAIGQQTAGVAKVLARLQDSGALDDTIVVVAAGDDPVGLRFVAPYAAMTMAEHVMDRGGDVVVVFDDLTRHARAYRELSLLLRRPPGREAFPGDIFYIHSRLLERASHVTEARGGGSITALPVIETEEENISGYIPTNLISITDGQIYLSPRLFGRGQLPAVEVGRSVSRVGGDAQLPGYRAVASSLRLAYTQFEELERFTRYGARLEEARRRELERGRRVRAVLTQPEGKPIPVTEQLAVLVAVTEGAFDDVEPEEVAAAADRLRGAVRDDPDLAGLGRSELDDAARRRIRHLAESARQRA